MNIEDIRDYCLSLPFTSEGLPFDQDTLVFYVKDKMFALCSLEKADRINLKCDPEKAIEYRERFPEVKAGYHMNKKHWNTVILTGNLTNDTIKQWIKDSYYLVVAKMPKKMQETILKA